MLIGELAQRAGVSKDTIRFYEKMGLLQSRSRPAGSRHYKDYDEVAWERLQFIQYAKTLGFTLNEIGQIMTQCQRRGSLPTAEKVAILERKLAETAQKIQDLRQVEAQLRDKLREVRREPVAPGGDRAHPP